MVVVKFIRQLIAMVKKAPTGPVSGEPDTRTSLYGSVYSTSSIPHWETIAHHLKAE